MYSHQTNFGNFNRAARGAECAGRSRSGAGDGEFGYGARGRRGRRNRRRNGSGAARRGLAREGARALGAAGGRRRGRHRLAARRRVESARRRRGRSRLRGNRACGQSARLSPLERVGAADAGEHDRGRETRARDDRAARHRLQLRAGCGRPVARGFAATPADPQGRDPRGNGAAPARCHGGRRARADRASGRLLRPRRPQQLVLAGPREARPPRADRARARARGRRPPVGVSPRRRAGDGRIARAPRRARRVLVLSPGRPLGRRRHANERRDPRRRGAALGRRTARRRLPVVARHARVAVRRDLARNARDALSVARSGAPGQCKARRRAAGETRKAKRIG